jgi:hypothetical protein
MFWNDADDGTLTSAVQPGHMHCVGLFERHTDSYSGLPPRHDDRANVEPAASGVTGRDEAEVL